MLWTNSFEEKVIALERTIGGVGCLKSLHPSTKTMLVYFAEGLLEMIEHDHFKGKISNLVRKQISAKLATSFSKIPSGFLVPVPPMDTELTGLSFGLKTCMLPLPNTSSLDVQLPAENDRGISVLPSHVQMNQPMKDINVCMPYAYAKACGEVLARIFYATAHVRNNTAIQNGNQMLVANNNEERNNGASTGAQGIPNTSNPPLAMHHSEPSVADQANIEGSQNNPDGTNPLSPISETHQPHEEDLLAEVSEILESHQGFFSSPDYHSLSLLSHQEAECLVESLCKIIRKMYNTQWHNIFKDKLFTKKKSQTRRNTTSLLLNDQESQAMKLHNFPSDISSLREFQNAFEDHEDQASLLEEGRDTNTIKNIGMFFQMIFGLFNTHTFNQKRILTLVSCFAFPFFLCCFYNTRTLHQKYISLSGGRQARYSLLLEK